MIVTFVAQITVVEGNSMEKTLHNNDRLIIEKISPRFGKLSRGDIVTLDVSDLKSLVHNSPIIKRVIGIEGDLIEIKDKKVYVNGNVLEENYTNVEGTDEGNFSKVTVPPGQIYVIGDNRMPGGSNDSRNIGPLELNRVGGRAIFRFFPFDKIGVIK
jgi:signal peptidase I